MTAAAMRMCHSVLVAHPPDPPSPSPQALPEDGTPKLLLDLGCGSGLSGEALSERGHVWVVSWWGAALGTGVLWDGHAPLMPGLQGVAGRCSAAAAP